MSTMFPWRDAENFAITAHAFVDPDALGSMIALGSFLIKAGKKVTFIAYGGVPKNLRFLLGGNSVVLAPDSWDIFDRIIVLDSSDIRRPGFPELENPQFASRIVNIDHHQDNAEFGFYNRVRPDASSTAELVYEIAREEGFAISGYESTALLAGLMGDTGSFKHSNTTPRVYEIAGSLLLAGAAQDAITKNLFAGKTVGQLKAWSHALENAAHDKESNAIISGITEDEIAAFDINAEALDAVVDILNTFPEASYAAFMRQQGGEVKVSLRSETYKNIDVSQIAKRFGGGGHALASGFKVPGKLIKKDQGFFIQPTTPTN